MGLGDLNPVRIIEGKGAIGESGLGSLIIGAGLASMGIPPGMAALYTGGATAALTGSLQKGLFAGMGAYGGAGLEAGLAGLGEKELAEKELAKTALSGTDLASDQFTAQQAAAQAANAEAIAADPLQSMNQTQVTPINAAQTGQTVQTTTQAPGLFDRAGQSLSNAGAGLERLTSSGGIDALRAQMAAAGGPSMGMAAGTAAAGALGSGLMAQRNPAADAKKLDPGYIRQFTYDPFSQKYTALTPVAADKWGARTFQDAYKAADGGIVALAHGGAVWHFDDGGVSDTEVQNWFDANKGASTQDIASAMNQYGVGTDQVARVTGTPIQTVEDLYTSVLGRASDTGGAEYWAKQFGDTIDPNEIATFRNAAQAELNARPAAPAAIPSVNYTDYELPAINAYINKNNLDSSGVAAATQQFNADPERVAAAQHAQDLVENVYRNVIGRDPDPAGLTYWTNQLMAGQVSDKDLYNTFLKSAEQNKELFTPGMSAEKAASTYMGYQSKDSNSIADEWVRNVLGREVTDADRQQQWYKDAMSASTMGSQEAAKGIYGSFLDYAKSTGAKTAAEKAALARQTIAAKGLTDADVYAQTGKTIEQLIGAPKTDLDIYHASQLLAPTNSEFDFQSLKGKQKAAATAATSPSTYAPTGTTNPYGNATNPGDITRNADGSTTITPNIPGRPYGGFTGMDQVRNAYTQGGGSLGYTSPVVTSAAQHKAMYDKQTGGSRAAFDYLMGGAPNPIVPSTPTGEIYKPYGESVLGIPADPTARALIWDAKTRRYIPNPQYVKPMTLEEKTAAAEKAKADATAKEAVNSIQLSAKGGLMGMASGGLGSLGGYSDGGRLLKGPGDGVSDSIPASIGDKQPARLADGEFVVPARIVSELGNGSTDAGARKLYAMMDRVQKARGKTTGKGKVATNSRADKYLPV